MRDDIDDETVARNLEAYMLWLFVVRHVLLIPGRFSVEVPDSPCSGDHRRPEGCSP
jgi:hypothetical protein